MGNTMEILGKKDKISPKKIRARRKKEDKGTKHNENCTNENSPKFQTFK